MGLSKEGTLRFKIDWASRIDGSKFSIFAVFLRGIFQVQAPRGGCVTGLGGSYLEGLIHGGAYFRNFTVIYYSKNVLQGC